MCLCREPPDITCCIGLGVIWKSFNRWVVVWFHNYFHTLAICTISCWWIPLQNSIFITSSKIFKKNSGTSYTVLKFCHEGIHGVLNFAFKKKVVQLGTISVCRASKKPVLLLTVHLHVYYTTHTYTKWLLHLTLVSNFTTPYVMRNLNSLWFQDILSVVVLELST